MSIHRKIATRYMISKGLIERPVVDQIQKSVVSARQDVKTLEELTERAVKLIDASEKKEHIYKEAGDMVFLFQSTLETLRDEIDALSYIVDSVSVETNHHVVPQARRKEIDKVLKSSSYTDVDDLQGYPWRVDDPPSAIQRDDEGAWSEIPPPSPRDYTNHGISYPTPNIDKATR